MTKTKPDVKMRLIIAAITKITKTTKTIIMKKTMDKKTKLIIFTSKKFHLQMVPLS